MEWSRLRRAAVLMAEYILANLFPLCWRMIPGILSRINAVNDIHPSSRS